MPPKTRSQHRAGQDATRADENVTAKEGNEKQLAGEQILGSSDVSNMRNSSGSDEKPSLISDMETKISSGDQSDEIYEAPSVQETDTTVVGEKQILQVDVRKRTMQKSDGREKQGIETDSEATKGIDRQGKPSPILPSSSSTTPIDVKDGVKTDGMRRRPMQKSDEKKEITDTRQKGRSPSPILQRKDLRMESNLYPKLDNVTVSSGNNSGPASRPPRHSTQSDASLQGKEEIGQYAFTDDFSSDGAHDPLTDDRADTKHAGEQSSREEKVMARYFIIAAFGVLIASLVAVFCYYTNRPIWLSPSEPAVEVAPVDRFITDISLLAEGFPSQNKRLWRTVKASVLHVLNETDSQYPVVILMASNTQNSQVASCVARKIASYFQSAQDLPPHKFDTANIGDFQQLDLDPAIQKEELDKKMNSAFGYSKQKAFIIENLQLLSPEAALMLHGYCDNDNAPFKDVMIVLMLHIDENVVKIIGPQSANAVENYLENLWSKGLHIDKVKALMSRVANNIVVIENENDATLQRVCQ